MRGLARGLDGAVRLGLARPWLRGLLLGVCCGLACWLLDQTSSVLRGVEDWCQDECFGWRGKRSTTSRVVIVGLDDSSLAGLPKPLAFLSPELAEVVTHVRKKGARVVGVDFCVPEELDNFPGLRGEAVGRAEEAVGGVVLAAFPAGGRLIRPLKSWRDSEAAIGLVDVTPDADHFLRRQRLARNVGGEDFDHFSVALLFVSGQVTEGETDGTMRVNDRVVPADRSGTIRVNFVGPPGTIREVSFGDVLAASRGGPPPDVDFRDAVVILGATAKSLGDWHATPFSHSTLRSLWSQTPTLMSGPEFHANVIATLEDGTFLTTPTWLASLPWSVGMGGVLGVAFARLSLSRGAGLALAHHMGWKLFCFGAFCYGPWRVEMVSMLLTGSVCFGASFALRWRWLRRSFGAFKGEAIAKALESDPGHLTRNGQERELTVLFADIRNFTTYSETHTPRQVVALLNAYFDAVVPVIERYGGALNQYMGDGVMVLFGAPDPQPDHPSRGVRAAVAIVRRVHELRGLWTSLDFPDLRVGVGVHTGVAVVGAVGSRDRLDYTAIGDTTNTASRIEATNKVLETEVLVSAATVAVLPPMLLARLRIAGPEPISVKGRRQEVAVHRVPIDEPAAPAAVASVPGASFQGDGGTDSTL